MYYLGLDLGSSSIKVALVNVENNSVSGMVHVPEKEMHIESVQKGWAEQDPKDWWQYVQEGIKNVLSLSGVSGDLVRGIGISYQMHGLVLVDNEMHLLRKSIIWCDSRAVEIGNASTVRIGEQQCLSSMLNTPANFTASKLKWVKENEPEIYERIYKVMLPGDFVAMKLTGKITTTISGLSEGIFWDFSKMDISSLLIDDMGFSRNIFPDIVPCFANQGKIKNDVAKELGLSNEVSVGYRAGDQPNNAMSLGVLEPGEIAATGGTSGVVYGVLSAPMYDKQSRVNCFAHVNHTSEQQRIGVLLCINGTGIQYRYIKDMMAEEGVSYNELEQKLSSVPIGSDGLRLIPFGNGAERILGNRDIGASVMNLQFNRHRKEHFYRAALEGIAFSFMYGVEVLKEMGMEFKKIRVGNDNLFQSSTFSQTISNLTGAKIEVVETNGAVGAAKGAAYGLGQYSTLNEAMNTTKVIQIFEPNQKNTGEVVEAYQSWKNDLLKLIK